MNTFMTLMQPYILEAVSAFVAIIVTYVLTVLKKKLGLDIEEKYRDALQLALTNGAVFAIGKLGAGASLSDIAKETVSYAQVSTPDAIKGLKASQEALMNLATVKVADKLLK